MRLSERVQRIQPSPTMAMDARTKNLIDQGVDVINLTAGEPDFDTPEFIRNAGIEAIHAGMTRYLPNSGYKPLLEAIVTKLKNENGLTYSTSQVLVSVGAKHSIYNAFQAIIDPGDEVILPAPYWVSYSEQIRLADGVPIVLPTDESTEFKITPEQLEANITERTKAIVLCSPSNPTGTVYSRDELAALGEVIVKHDLIVVSDEIYEKIVYDGHRPVSIATLSDELYERTIVINGVSKSYAMTGWRIGYAAGPQPIISAMAAVQSHVTSCAASMSQAAAVAAITGDQQAVEEMRRAFAERRDLMVARLNALPGVHCFNPGGAFYCFPNVSALFGRTLAGHVANNCDELAEIFLEEAKVAVVPGSGFAAPNNLRISFATSLERIEEAMDRLEALFR